MNVIYHPLAERDVEGILDHYKDILPSLAVDFLSEFDQSIARLLSKPHRYRVIKNDIRICKMKRFPFSVYFQIDGDTIHVLVIRHHRQHPSFGLDRL